MVPRHVPGLHTRHPARGRAALLCAARVWGDLPGACARVCAAPVGRAEGGGFGARICECCRYFHASFTTGVQWCGRLHHCPPSPHGCCRHHPPRIWTLCASATWTSCCTLSFWRPRRFPLACPTTCWSPPPSPASRSGWWTTSGPGTGSCL